MTTAEPQIKKEIRIEAPRETVFPFLTEPDLMIRWGGTEANPSAVVSPMPCIVRASMPASFR